MIALGSMIEDMGVDRQTAIAVADAVADRYHPIIKALVGYITVHGDPFPLVSEYTVTGPAYEVMTAGRL